MHRKNLNAHFNIIQVFIDLTLLLLAFFSAQSIYFTVNSYKIDFSEIWILVDFSAIFILSMLLFRMYDITTFHYLDRIFLRTFGSTVFAGICIGTALFLTDRDYNIRMFFAFFVIISYTFISCFRVISRFIRRKNLSGVATRVLFIGDEKMYDKYMKYVSKTSMNIKVEQRLAFDAKELKSEEELEKLLIDININEIVVVHKIRQSSKIDTHIILKASEDMGITTHLLLDTFNLEDSQYFVSSIGTLPVLTYHSVSLDRVQLFIKAVVGVISSAIALIVFSPVLLITAIAIRIESPGPVLFAQVRVGRNGKRFKMYKFRSMYQDAEERKAELQAQNKIKGGLMFKIDNDPRITKVGKFIRKTSIDELPQLINVIKRDMSLVGTRPPTVDEVEKYERHHHRRLSIMPGITGMWQVNGRSQILDFEHVVELDNEYIQNWSLLLDFKILIKTVIAVFARRGAV